MSKKEKLLNYYKTELARMLSNVDFIPFFGIDVEKKIMLYSELKNYGTIDDLFPKPNDYRIILIESEPRSGHWCSIIKINGNLIWFDSYGCFPDTELRFISKIKNRLLGQTQNEIRRLMKGVEKIGLKAWYSKTKYQSESDNISTCGRWVAISIHMLYELQYSLAEMKIIFDRVKEDTGKPFDIIAVDFSSK